MPKALKRPCNKPGCPELTDSGYCAEHKKQRNAQRGTAHERGYTHRWAKYSKWYLRRNPLCVCAECKQRVVPLPAEVTDHIIPHKGDYALFWDPENHQAMAKRCHDIKTATEDGGFGR
jgi:5-methylcytosine-specific restriction protein A